MKQIVTVFSYTFKEGIRKKAFIVSTAIIMVLLLLLCLVPRVMSMVKGDDEKEQTKTQESADAEAQANGDICYLIDTVGIFEENIDMMQAIYPERVFKTEKLDQEEALKKEIKEQENNALVVIEEKNNLPFVRVINANFMKGVSSEKISDVCNKIWQKSILEGSGMNAETITQIQTELPYSEEAVGDMDITGYVLGIAVVLVMFFAVYYYGYSVSMSVASEKTSRVMETLVVSAKPSRILIGKCLAMGVLGLLQLLSILIFAVICYSLLIPKDFAVAGAALDFSSITPGSILLLLAYFILGYSLYAVMNAVCGAAVSKIEDLNSAMMPITFISIAAFYLGYFTAIAGGGSSALSKFAMYLPFSSPFSVPFTLLTGGMKTVDLVISLSLLVLFIIVIAAASIRVYSASVLHYGNKLKLKELMKMK